jgi:polysaccharide biosynthesis transport protein
LEKALHTEEERHLTAAKEDFVLSRSNQDQPLAALEQQKAQAYKMRGAMVGSTLHQREVESNRTLYEGLLPRLRIASAEAGLKPLEIDIVNQALLPAAPTPQPKGTIV